MFYANYLAGEGVAKAPDHVKVLPSATFVATVLLLLLLFLPKQSFRPIFPIEQGDPLNIDCLWRRLAHS